LAGSYSQIISAEIKEIEESNGNGDIESNQVTRITDSIDTKAEGLFLSAGNQQNFALKFKEVIGCFKKGIKKFKKGMRKIVGAVKDKLLTY
jgi:hypothetical protein